MTGGGRPGPGAPGGRRGPGARGARPLAAAPAPIPAPGTRPVPAACPAGAARPAVVALPAGAARPVPAALLAPAALLGLAALLAAGAVASLGAQATERYGERLSRMPVDYRTTATITGEGLVTGELRGNALTLRARFSGLSSPATAAHLHHAPRGRRGGVAFALDLGAATDTAGEFTDTIRLTAEQVAELRAERYYLQIHTDGNPGGELRGWLLRRGSGSADGSLRLRDCQQMPPVARDRRVD